MSDLNLKLISFERGVAHIRWMPNLQDVKGYQFYRNFDKVSQLLDPARQEATIAAQPGDRINVRAIMFVTLYDDEVFVA